jgi:proline iminopeptidase
MKAAIRGTEIYFDIAGMHIAPHKNDFVERPVLFLLHGGPGGDHLRFKQHSLELQEVAQLVFIDHRGCGRSKKTKASDYTLENNIEDVEALRQHLGLDRIMIMGTSYGGIVAQGYAIKYPKHLDKLLLVVTAPSFRFIEAAKAVVKKRANPQQHAMCERLWQGDLHSPQDISEFFKVMDSLYSVKSKKTGKAVFSKMNTQWCFEAWRQGFCGFMRTFDLTPKLKKIKCPTLILGGNDDWICPPSQSREIAKHIPHAQLKIFKNCGHTMAVDVHDQYIKIMKKFITTNK